MFSDILGRNLSPAELDTLPNLNYKSRKGKSKSKATEPAAENKHKNSKLTITRGDLPPVTLEHILEDRDLPEIYFRKNIEIIENDDNDINSSNIPANIKEKLTSFRNSLKSRNEKKTNLIFLFFSSSFIRHQV